MGFYRTTRNIEASLIDHIKSQLNAENWNNVAVEKSFARAYSIQLDANKTQAVICVRASTTNQRRFQIGSDAMIRSQLILIDVFATSDGQRLDLVDFLTSKLKCGLPYYEYKTEKSEISSRTQNGRLTVLEIEDNPVNFNTDKSSLEIYDRYRHLITLTIQLGKAEI